MAVLLPAETSNGTLNEATAKALTAAKTLNEPVHILVAGDGVEAAGRAAASPDGTEKVLLADDPIYAHHLAEPLAALLVQLAGDYRRFWPPRPQPGRMSCREWRPSST